MKKTKFALTIFFLSAATTLVATISRRTPDFPFYTQLYVIVYISYVILLLTLIGVLISYFDYKKSSENKKLPVVSMLLNTSLFIFTIYWGYSPSSHDLLPHITSSTTGPVRPAATSEIEINGASIETYKASIESIRKGLNGKKLEEFNYAISTIELILKDAAHIALDKYTAEKVVQERVDFENQFVSVANIEIQSLYSENQKNYLNFLRTYNELFDARNSYVRHLNKYGGNEDEADRYLARFDEWEKKRERLISIFHDLESKFRNHEYNSFDEAMKNHSKIKLMVANKIQNPDNDIASMNKLKELFDKK